MEMKYTLMHSNDPRFVYNIIRSFGGFCYYANHYEKIIRDGYFLSGTRSLNGPGRIINYNNCQIIMVIGNFIDDKPIGNYTMILSEYPYYQNIYNNLNITEKYGNKTYFCHANQKKYIQNNNDVLLIDEFIIFLKLTVRKGQLIDCEYIETPNESKLKPCNELSFNDIFNTKWKDTEIHKYDEHNEPFDKI